MAFDDPVVWVLIIAVVIFLFGSSKIPQLARSLGQARKEFESGWKGISNEIMTASGTPDTPLAVPLAPRPQPVVPQATPVVTASSARLSQVSDPLLLACKNEGIDIAGKTKEQLASELAWKLNKK
ncbi:MAG: twin-arginine translocase TatA/TatE family subunit [Nitrososphaerales archaeon]|jgi:sec-independent protein translocase protein TatA